MLIWSCQAGGKGKRTEEMHECSVGGYWGQGEMEAGSPLWLPLKSS